MAAEPKGEPIPVICEGSGCPGHPTAKDGWAMCSMCGYLVTTDGMNVVGLHHRDDIIARIHRGDFG